MPARTTASTPDVTAELVYLTRGLKAPTMREGIARLAERARADGWNHEQFLAAYLEREVPARAAHGGELRVKAARLPLASPWRSSTSLTRQGSSAIRSLTWGPWTSSPARRT
jgi:hypothetical protein